MKSGMRVSLEELTKYVLDKDSVFGVVLQIDVVKDW